MKALVYTGPLKAEVLDVEEPTPRAGCLKIKMNYCGICGSDIGIYLGGHPRAKAPLVLGHEFVGEVADASGSKRGFKKGDRVVAYPLISCGHCLPCRTGNAHVCRTLGLIGIDVDGGICEAAYIDEDVLVRVPENLSDKAAAVVEPLAVIVRTIHQAGFKALDSAAIIGAGPIGQLTALALKHMGASRVFISDLDPVRLQKAAQYGAVPVCTRDESLFDAVCAATEGEGVDVVFECSGAESAAMDMTRLVRIGGTVCMTAIHKKPHLVNLQELNFREVTLVGSRVYTKEEFKSAVAFAAQISDALETVVSHIVPLRESDKVFDMIKDPTLGTVKVLVDCTQI